MAKLDSLHTLHRTVRSKVKKLLSALSDHYIVRDQMIDNERLSPLLIEGPHNSWAFCGYAQHALPPDILNKLDSYNKGREERGYSPIKYLLISAQEQDLFSPSTACPHLITLALDSSPEVAAARIKDALTALPDEQHDNFKSQFVKESIVITRRKTRRFTDSRSNDACLGNFFLDYDQERATKMGLLHAAEDSPSDKDDYSVNLINGVAGSGKTLILINRALLYQKKNPDKKTIILIHNKPIVSWVRSIIRQHSRDIAVETFHAFAKQQAERALATKINPLFKLYASHIPNLAEQIKLDKDKIAEEIEYINDYLISSEEAYLEYERQGRGFSLQKNQRSLIWQLYENITAALKTNNTAGQPHLASLYIRDLCLLDSPENLRKYDHIMIDEAQFFAPSWLQLAKKSLQANGKIFMCADPNQGFLKHRLSWRSVGLNVQGRTRKLQQPYRSTYQIMAAANRLISLIQEEDEDYVKPEFRSIPHGPKPKVIYTASQADENTRFLNELNNLIHQNSIPLEQIVVLTSGYADNIQQLIEQRIGQGISLDINNYTQQRADQSNKIRVMSINSCTGIEASIVLVLGAGKLIAAYNDIRLSAEEKQQTMHESIRKLYVSMTRAAQHLVIFSTEPLPSILGEAIESSGRTA
ncbi:MAG: UvrD-helicase domain-containing protein [Thiopseudomonas sp.]|nr:UvrD-helicase domain-containing protein [Thiopseudomonas sp.]